MDSAGEHETSGSGSDRSRRAKPDAEGETPWYRHVDRSESGADPVDEAPSNQDRPNAATAWYRDARHDDAQRTTQLGVDMTPVVAPSLERPPSPGSRDHRIGWIALSLGAALVGIAVAAAVLVTAITGGSGADGPKSVELSADDRHFLEDGLSASDPQAFVEVLAPAVRDSLPNPEAVLLPDGSAVHIDGASFDADPLGTATVDATTTGAEEARWRLFLVFSDGRWRLVTTERVT